MKFKLPLIFICTVTTAFTLSQYANLVQHLLSVKYNWLFELVMVIGMVLFQWAFINKNSRDVVTDYLLKMLQVSVIGSVLLWPLLFMNRYYNFADTTNIIYFFAVVTIMFFIHKNIVAKMELPFYLSYTYILYRFIILLFII
ncbi:MAG: hypothetical protein ACKVOM_14505 [Ferruginibacter sp.]